MTSLRADLHTHSTCSDGTLTPEAVIAAADIAGLAWLALTDHDTADGITRARAAIASRELPLELVTGAELSCHSERDGEVHILAYGFDENDAGMQAHMAGFRDERRVRLLRMLELLAASGCALTQAQVEAECRGLSIGRMHVAAALVRAGHVGQINEAFARYLGNGCPAYVARKKYSPEEMIRIIHSWGAVAVLAHPQYFDRLDEDVRFERLEWYVGQGIDGFEAWHPHVDKKLKRELKRLARRHGLVLTGGSDSHGSSGNRPRVGAVTVTDEHVRSLLERIAAQRRQTNA